MTLGKSYTTEILPIRIDDPEALHLLHDAHRIVVTLKGKKTYNLEGPERVQIVGDIIAVSLSQGMMAGLYGRRVKVEVTLALPFGVVKKTKTLEIDVTQAVREVTT